MTLNKSSSIREFLTRRVLRLFPLLLVCSLLTFFLPFLLDAPNKYLMIHRPRANFLPSLTFTDLWIWNKVFHIHSRTNSIEFIDNAYWTLGIEMRFYVCMALLYFSSRNNFYKNWLIFTLGLISLYIGTTMINTQLAYNLGNLLETTFFAKYILYFTLGTLFYRLYEKLKIDLIDYCLIFISAIICICRFMPLTETVALLIFCGLFLTFIYKPGYLSLLTSKPVLFIGMVSYPLYLIHQNVGVLSLNLLTDYYKPVNPAVFILPVMLLMVLFAYILHRYIELPLTQFLKPRSRSKFVQVVKHDKDSTILAD